MTSPCGDEAYFLTFVSNATKTWHKVCRWVKEIISNNNETALPSCSANKTMFIKYSLSKLPMSGLRPGMVCHFRVDFRNAHLALHLPCATEPRWNPRHEEPPDENSSIMAFADHFPPTEHNRKVRCARSARLSLFLHGVPHPPLVNN